MNYEKYMFVIKFSTCSAFFQYIVACWKFSVMSAFSSLTKCFDIFDLIAGDAQYHAWLTKNLEVIRHIVAIIKENVGL